MIFGEPDYRISILRPYLPHILPIFRPYLPILAYICLYLPVFAYICEISQLVELGFCVPGNPAKYAVVQMDGSAAEPYVPLPQLAELGF